MSSPTSWSQSRTLPVLLTSTFLVGMCLYLVGLATDSFVLSVVSKVFPVLALIVWVGLRAPGFVGRATVVGLCFGLGGDVLLELGGDTFLFGLVSFLCGHIAYSVGFSRGSGRLSLPQALPFLAYCGAVAVIIVPTLGDMAIPVVAYMGFIGVMAWRSASYAEASGGWAWACLIGAVTFLLSDTLIAVDRFVEPIPGIRPAIILTYWAAQAAIATGVVRNEALQGESPQTGG